MTSRINYKTENWKGIIYHLNNKYYGWLKTRLLIVGKHKRYGISHWYAKEQEHLPSSSQSPGIFHAALTVRIGDGG